MRALRRRRQAGVNMIELLIAIVVISIACTGVLLVYAQTVRFSADPMIQTQAVAIAEGYLEEILARPLADPDTEGGETRATFDDIADYNGLNDSPPQDQNGNVADFAPADGIADLAGFSVTVTVTSGVLIGGVSMSRVDVRVQYAPVVDVILSGYRAP